MKEKIEFNQADMVDMLVEKVNFLTEEYQKLHSSFTYDGKGRTITDPVKIAESYQRFLNEYGDVKRILKMYELFNVEDTKKTRKTTIEEEK